MAAIALLARGELREEARNSRVAPEHFDLLRLFRQRLLISVHDHLAKSVEDADLEHAIHGGHNNQILAICRFAADFVHRGRQPQIKSLQ